LRTTASYIGPSKQADATKLQEDIDALQNWESTWEMSFNPDTCEARSHFTLCRVATFEDYFRGATGEKVCNPQQSITSHSRVVEFQEKTSVGNFIEK
jgi:hypothetical protein